MGYDTNILSLEVAKTDMGHADSHLLQDIPAQRSDCISTLYIEILSLITLIALSGHDSTHFLQPIHPSTTPESTVPDFITLTLQPSISGRSLIARRVTLMVSGFGN